MKDLLRWEMKQTLKSKAFWGMGIAFILSVFLFLLMPLFEGGVSGYDMFLQNMNNFNAFVIFYSGIYAGIHITGAFEHRKIQAAVMAGNSRLNVIISKLISYAFSIACFCISSVTINSIIGFIAGGTAELQGDYMVPVVMRGLTFVLVEVAFSSICVIISMLVKNLGAAISVNLISLLVLNIATEYFIARDMFVDFFKFTPNGQTFMIFYDATPQNLTVAAIGSVLSLIAILALCFLKVRKEELK